MYDVHRDDIENFFTWSKLGCWTHLQVFQVYHTSFTSGDWYLQSLQLLRVLFNRMRVSELQPFFTCMVSIFRNMFNGCLATMGVLQLLLVLFWQSHFVTLLTICNFSFLFVFHLASILPGSLHYISWNFGRRISGKNCIWKGVVRHMGCVYSLDVAQTCSSEV